MGNEIKNNEPTTMEEIIISFNSEYDGRFKINVDECISSLTQSPYFRHYFIKRCICI